MNIPMEFDHLVGCFWDGSHARAKTLDEWVGNAVRLLDAHQKAVIKPFIEDLLSRDLPDKELNRIWNEGLGSTASPTSTNSVACCEQ